ncbi:MAG: rhodanese-like domain-containing protein [Alphaproteobacteria bacterium]|jgi:rhodanese-related sulfurtransferase|nr:rhodanese-like domain-containing protein [Alphaproteobacteria bacterium]
MLARERSAVLVDVRTPAEWGYVGRPNLTNLGTEAHLVPWQLGPGMGTNADFLDGVCALADSNDVPLLFLCRSGVRSVNAAKAVTAAGFTRCYNIIGGFEGNKDEHGHRGTLEGWKVAGLDWVQD